MIYGEYEVGRYLRNIFSAIIISQVWPRGKKQLKIDCFISGGRFWQGFFWRVFLAGHGGYIDSFWEKNVGWFVKQTAPPR